MKDNRLALRRKLFRPSSITSWPRHFLRAVSAFEAAKRNKTGEVYCPSLKAEKVRWIPLGTRGECHQSVRVLRACPKKTRPRPLPPPKPVCHLWPRERALEVLCAH